MIFFVEAAEIIFILYSAVRSIAYGIWNIKNKNKGGGLMVLGLTLILLIIFALSLYK